VYLQNTWQKFGNDGRSDLRDYAAKKESLKKETTVAVYKVGSASYPCRVP